MKARFRIRQGERELRAETLQEFEELVRAGEIAEDDLVHDALTGEFAPARTHPVWQLVQDASEVEGAPREDAPPPPEEEAPAEVAEEAPTEVVDEAPAEAADETPAGAVDDPSAGLFDLAPEEVVEDEAPAEAVEDEAPAEAAGVPETPEPEPEEAPSDDAEMTFPVELVEEQAPSAEEKAEAFIEEMERERQEERDRGMGEPVDLSGLAPAAPRRPARPENEVTDVSGPRPFRPDEDEERPFRAWGPADDGPSRTPPTRAAAPRPGRRRRTAAILAASVVVLAVTAAVAHPAFRFAETLPEPEPVEIAEPLPEPPRPLTDTEMRTSARVAFLDRVDSLRSSFSLGRVPRVWLEGRYLAEASAFPEVERFWTNYLRYVEQVYAEEDALYREAYLDVLGGTEVDGPVRSLRLARATADFQVRAVDRHALYADVWELAVAARSLHELLVEREDAISWEPAASERLSADPVTEAVGSDEETQALLEDALDRVLDALYAVTGDGRDIHGEEPDWLFRSLADGGADAFFPAQQ